MIAAGLIAQKDLMLPAGDVKEGVGICEKTDCAYRTAGADASSLPWCPAPIEPQSCNQVITTLLPRSADVGRPPLANVVSVTRLRPPA